jgi:hypothetical protein
VVDLFEENVLLDGLPTRKEQAKSKTIWIVFAHTALGDERCKEMDS